MSRPPLPTYSSPENSTFHPVFVYAAHEALKAMGLQLSIEVKEQFPTATGPVDIVFFDKTTQKVVLPIEIKRTQSHVRGGGRRQARDYWNNLGTQCQTPFYCVSNLELTQLFRNASDRPRTSAQQVQIANPVSGSLFNTPKNTFYDNLVVCICDILDLVLCNSPHRYLVGMTQFQSHINSNTDDIKKWHQFFAPACFEYIRGAALKTSHLKSATSSWKTASFYDNQPHRLNQLGLGLDFEHVFNAPYPVAKDQNAFAPSILLEAYEGGKALAAGDDIAELVNEVLAPYGPGIVQTDHELAQLLAILGRAALGRNLSPLDEVLDPGSGSGRLLTALPLLAFTNISPTQIRAIEAEQRFAESLSLRLGLAFSSVISRKNAPNVQIAGIETIDEVSLKNVRVVVMNPPFLSGVQSVARKNIFAERIKFVSGSSSILDKGQIAFEALFLELVWHLVQSGTVIAMIFPIQHLFRLSKEVVALRKFLLDSFGLTHISIYPQRGLFEGVIKQTAILVGQKGSMSKEISLVEVQKQVSNIDFHSLQSSLHSGGLSSTHGVALKMIDREELSASVKEGWKSIIGDGIGLDPFLDGLMYKFKCIHDLPDQDFGRGTLGNRGNNALTVFDPLTPRYPSVMKLIPGVWRRSVLNTTKDMPRLLTPNTAPQESFLPPQTAYTAGTHDHQVLVNIIREYLLINKPKNGKQIKRQKTESDILSSLKTCQKEVGAGWVLIQRASRKKGEIGMLECSGVLLSTNVVMVKLQTSSERALMASWLLSVFGQIQFERNAVPQEGLRKLEMGGVGKIRFPDFSKIPDALATILKSTVALEPAIEFSNIQQRPSDLIWARILNPTDPTSTVNTAFELLKCLVDERVGFG